MSLVDCQILVWDWKTGKQIVKIASLVLGTLAETERFTNNVSLSQPFDHARFYGFSFVDRSSILFPYSTSSQEPILRFQVTTFESPNTTDKAALHFYHFALDILGPQSEPSEFLSNTLPSNTSNSCFPGFFHSDPSSRLLALEVDLLRVLYVPHAVLLDYIRLHPSDTDTVVVPWEAWGPGNAHTLTRPQHPPDGLEHPTNRFGSKIVCGMHAITDPPMVLVQGDRMILRIMDYHPRRIVRNLATRGAADSHEGLGPSGTPAWQEAGMSTDENIPYTSKDIPLPDGLQSKDFACVLGEDVVAVFEVGIPKLLLVRFESTHTVPVFFRLSRLFWWFPSWSQDGEAKECVLPPHLVCHLVTRAA